MKQIIIAGFLIVAAVSVRGELFSFYGITSNDPSGNAVNIGETQLSMDVNVMSPGLVSLIFMNTGPDDSSVSEIYFDSPAVTPPFNLVLDSIINGSGVKFVEDAQPPDLPGGSLIQFCADEAVEAGNPAPKNGINPGEYLELQLSYTDPPHDFIEMLGTGELRVGLHVVDLGENGEYSESFINIPEPSTALLIGLIGLAGKGIRKIFRVV